MTYQHAALVVLDRALRFLSASLAFQLQSEPLGVVSLLLDEFDRIATGEPSVWAPGSPYEALVVVCLAIAQELLPSLSTTQAAEVLRRSAAGFVLDLTLAEGTR